MLTLAGIKFTDERIEFPQWQGLKPKTPWGSLPYLTLADGTVLGKPRGMHAVFFFVELFWCCRFARACCLPAAWSDLRGVLQHDALLSLSLCTGQSLAINRFVARLTGLYPADPLQAAHVDAIIDGASDLFPAVMKVGVGLDQAAKEAARSEACKSGRRLSGLLFIVSYDDAVGRL